MAKEADVAGWVLEARVFLVVHRAVFAGLVDVGIDDGRAVENHLDMRAFGDDLFGVPLADLFGKAAFGGHHAVDRSVVLIRMQVPVHLPRRCWRRGSP